MIFRRITLIVAVLLTLSASVEQSWARRSSNAVRRERTQAARNQAATRQRIRNAEEETRRQLNLLESLDARIEKSQRREQVLSARVDSITRAHNELTDSVTRLTERVERIDNSYQASLRAIRRQRTAASPIAFVFASSSFRQAIRRLRYMGDLAGWSAREGTRLKAERQLLAETVARLDSTRNRLETSRRSLATQRQRLQADQAEARQVVEELRRHSRELNNILATQQRQMASLDSELNAAIEAEQAEARRAEEERRRAEEERRRAEEERRRQQQQQQQQQQSQTTPAQTQQPAQTSQPSAQRPATPEPQSATTSGRKSAAELTASFKESKGKLPMPVDGNATIVSNFGRRTHTEFARVEVQNNGIDIEAASGANVLAVHDGTVSMIILMDGFRNVVLVRHGEYLTVYAGLENLNVRKGDYVHAGQSIGTLHTIPGDEHGTRLHFEVRHEKEKLDPRQWLR